MSKTKAGQRFFLGPITSEAKGSRMREQISQDIDYILQEVSQCTTTLDELALLRTSLRAYSEGRSAVDAVAWSAQQLSNSMTSTWRQP
jgi:hypothetical protein